MWCQHVLGGPYIDSDVGTLLVFDSIYHSNATRVYLKEHKVKVYWGYHPQSVQGSVQHATEKGAQSWLLYWDY